MRIRVLLFGHIRTSLGASELILDCSAIEVRDLLSQICGKLEGTTKPNMDDANTLILVNGVEVSALKGMRSRIKDGDQVALIPYAHGG